MRQNLLVRPRIQPPLPTKSLNPLLVLSYCTLGKSYTADKMSHSSVEKLRLLPDEMSSEGKSYSPSNKPYSRGLSRSTKTVLMTFLVLLLLCVCHVKNSEAIFDGKELAKGDYGWGDVCSPHSHCEIDTSKDSELTSDYRSPRPKTLNSTPASTATTVPAWPSR